ncbi:hypothetical protein J6590_023688 [Homalodisca vitripennis]|nr:hypothetical protein J6590_023688 [Homalodisca vitripennis]
MAEQTTGLEGTERWFMNVYPRKRVWITSANPIPNSITDAPTPKELKTRLKRFVVSHSIMRMINLRLSNKCQLGDCRPMFRRVNDRYLYVSVLIAGTPLTGPVGPIRQHTGQSQGWRRACYQSRAAGSFSAQSRFLWPFDIVFEREITDCAAWTQPRHGARSPERSSLYNQGF